eukprot:c12014_g1_i1.p1 GENE.c12014_g1_i1~~c12014_g1_i1.p1  ORF type:complete len:319 (-),score=27.44 c12014_g1_i1:499-1455(-)
MLQNVVAVVFARLVETMCRINPQTTISPFDMASTNKPLLTDYARRLATHLTCSESTFIVAAHFAEKLFTLKPHYFGVSSEHKIMAACAVLAVKVSEDRWFKNRRYAAICGFSLRTLATLEALILASLDFRVFVHVEQYLATLGRLKGLLALDNIDQSYQFPIIQDGFEVSPVPLTHKRRIAPDEQTLANETQTKRSRWSDDEDKKLRQLVDQHGSDWGLIATFLPGRNGRSCSVRWNGKLKPGLASGPFEDWEDSMLVCLVEQNGKKWSLISTKFDGRRSARQLNDRYNSLVKRGADCVKEIRCTPPKTPPNAELMVV